MVLLKHGCCLTTVYRQAYPRDVCPLTGGEEHDRRSELIRLARAAHRDASCALLNIVAATQAPRFDQRRTDGIDRHAVRGRLVGQMLKISGDAETKYSGQCMLLHRLANRA